MGRMAFNQMLMTDSQQKEFSKLCTAVRSAQDYLKYQQEMSLNKPLTYVQKRVADKLNTAQKRLDALDDQLEKEIQRLRDDYKQRKKELEEKVEEYERELSSQTDPPGVVDAKVRLKFALQKRDAWITAIDPTITSYTAPQPPPTHSNPIRSLMTRQMEIEHAKELEDSKRRIREAEREQREREEQQREEREKQRLANEQSRRALEEQERKRHDEIRQRELRGEKISLEPPVTSSNSSLTDPKDDNGGWNSEDDREGEERMKKKVTFVPPPSRPKKGIKRVMIKEVAPGISTYPVPLTED